MTVTRRPARRMPSMKSIWSWWEPRLEAWMPEVGDLLREAMWVGGGEHPTKICWTCAGPFESSSPDRAHIAGRFNGDGLDTPANFVLLCHRCHLAQPDATWTQGLLWVRRRAWIWNHGGFMAGQFPDTSQSSDQAYGSWIEQLLTSTDPCMARIRDDWRQLSEAENRRIFDEVRQCLYAWHDEAADRWTAWHQASPATALLMSGSSTA